MLRMWVRSLSFTGAPTELCSRAPASAEMLVVPRVRTKTKHKKRTEVRQVLGYSRIAAVSCYDLDCILCNNGCCTDSYSDLYCLIHMDKVPVQGPLSCSAKTSCRIVHDHSP